MVILLLATNLTVFVASYLPATMYKEANKEMKIDAVGTAC